MAHDLPLRPSLTVLAMQPEFDAIPVGSRPQIVTFDDDDAAARIEFDPPVTASCHAQEAEQSSASTAPGGGHFHTLLATPTAAALCLAALFPTIRSLAPT